TRGRVDRQPDRGCRRHRRREGSRRSRGQGARLDADRHRGQGHLRAEHRHGARRWQARPGRRVVSYFDTLIEQGKTDPIGAAAEMTKGLMRGDPTTMKLGYSIGNALISAVEQFKIEGVPGMAMVVERVVDETTEHYSATNRPLVVNVVKGGVVHETYALPGLGKPEAITLDFDIEGLDEEQAEEFLDLVAGTRKQLEARGEDIGDYWLAIADRLRAEHEKDWPVDHEMGKE